MIMAAAVASPTYPGNVKLPSSERVKSGVIVLDLHAMLHKPSHAFGQKLSSRCCLLCRPQPLLVNNFKYVTVRIGSNSIRVLV